MKHLTDNLRHAMSQTVRITDDEWAAFEPFIKLKHYKKRENFNQEGQICREVGFILRGSFRQFYVVDGEEKTTFFMFENNFVTDYESFLKQAKGELTIEAMEDAEVLTFDYPTIQRFYRIYPTFETFGRLIGEYLFMCLQDRLKGFMLNSPEERYRRFLTHPESSLILARVPQHYIAAYLGITPVSLSRIRNRLAKTERQTRVLTHSVRAWKDANFKIDN
jgi:CRP-like cAMP-binding protein